MVRWQVSYGHVDAEFEMRKVWFSDKDIEKVVCGIVYSNHIYNTSAFYLFSLAQVIGLCEKVCNKSIHYSL